MALTVRLSGLAVLVADRVAVTTATTPLTVLAFMPLTRQVTVPTPALQLSVLPAAVRPDPAAVLSVVIALDG